METRAFPCRINLNGHVFEAIATLETQPAQEKPGIDFIAAIRKGIATYDSTAIFTDLGRIVDNEFPFEVTGFEVSAEVCDGDTAPALGIVVRPMGCTNPEHFTEIARFSLTRPGYPTLMHFDQYKRIVNNSEELQTAIAELLASPAFGKAFVGYRDV